MIEYEGSRTFKQKSKQNSKQNKAFAESVIHQNPTALERESIKA
jgi:hypothetical protein